jgi:hypothetical protein
VCFFYRLKPIAVLTDLRDNYTLFWLDDHILYYYAAPDRGTAWGLLDAMLKVETVTERGVELRQDLTEGKLIPLAKRQCLKFDAHEGHAVAELQDLEGFLDPAELRGAQAIQLLQEFMRIPAIAAVRADLLDTSSSGHMSMYS